MLRIVIIVLCRWLWFAIFLLALLLGLCNFGVSWWWYSRRCKRWELPNLFFDGFVKRNCIYLVMDSSFSCCGSKGKGKAVPLQAWSGPDGSRKLRFPDFMTTAHDGVKVVSLTHRPPLTPGNKPGAYFCQSLSQPQGHSVTERTIPMKTSEIKPANCRFVAQCLNHYASARPCCGCIVV